jgi:DNA-binding PadR family transcriptional regulator
MYNTAMLTKDLVAASSKPLLLSILAGGGLIDSEWKEADTGRERKYYFISSDGRKALKTERQQWLAVHNTLSKLWKIKPVSI